MAADDSLTCDLVEFWIVEEPDDDDPVTWDKLPGGSSGEKDPVYIP